MHREWHNPHITRKTTSTMKILLFGNEYQQQYAHELQHLVEVLRHYSINLEIEHSFYQYLHYVLGIAIDKNECGSNQPGIMTGDVALSIGGDGTFLRTARMVARNGIPILGINTGHLGYLAAATFNDIDKAIADLLEKKYKTGSRTMLEINYDCNVEIDNTLALNEVAVLRQDNCSILGMHTCVNGVNLTTYRGDGLVVSTPTGSTAYNLSVGGPLIEPSANVIVLSPISPHSLTMRPLVLGDNSVIEIETRSRESQYLVSLDGQVYSFPSGTKITVRKSDTEVKIIELSDHNFADTLRKKLMWGL